MDFISRDKNGSLYVNNNAQKFVRQFNLNTLPVGNIVAGTGSAVTGSFARPTGTAVDDSFNLYIADSNNLRVMKLVPGGTTLTTVINASPLSAISAILLRNGTSNQMYLSDIDAKEVFLWTFGSPAPDAIYKNVTGGSTLDNPRGIKLDPLGNLYVTDQSNKRVVMFCLNSTVGIVVLSVTTSPVDIAFDSGMNLYALLSSGILYKYARL